MHTIPCCPRGIRLALCVLLLGTVVVLLSACDSKGPQSPEPKFNMDIGAPVSTSVSGAAALGSNLSFDEQNVFTFPAGPFGKTLSIIQLFGETDQGASHDLSFLHLGDEPIGEGDYDVGLSCEEGCGFENFPPDELFTASYGRQTTDSLHSYPLKSGTVTIETATDEEVSGTFTLTSTLEASVSRDDMQAYLDSLRSNPPPRDTSALPTLPPRSLEVLDEPMTVEGRFTATSGEPVSGHVPHVGGFGVGIVSDTIVVNP